MTASIRLQRAGIGATFTEGGVPLGRLISADAIRTPHADRPGALGDAESRAKTLGKALGLPLGLSGPMLVAWPVGKDVDLDAAFRAAFNNNGEELIPVAGYLKREGLRGDFSIRVSHGNDQVAKNAMNALLAIGVTEGERDLLVSQVNGENEGRRYFALATLAQSGLLAGVLEEGSITNTMDDDEVLATLIELCTSGSVEGLADALDEKGWNEHVGMLHVASAAATEHASAELLEVLLSFAENQNDVDVLVPCSWAVGACVRALGVDAAKMVLEACRDSYGSGSTKRSTMLNGVLRMEATADNIGPVLEIVAEIAGDDEDGDTQRSLGRLRDAFGDQCDPMNWLFNSSWGRGTDFYEVGECVIPQAVRNVLNPPEGEPPVATIGYLKAVAMDETVGSMIAASACSAEPETVSLYRNWLLGDINTNLKPGLASVLLFTDVEHDVSPILLRCYLGADAGGPVGEDDGTVGELIAYSTNWTLRDTAYSLLGRGSLEMRGVAAAYLDAALRLKDDDNMATALMQTGICRAQAVPLAEPSALLRMAAGETIDPAGMAVLLAANEEDRAHIWAMVRQVLMSGKMDTVRSLVRTKAIFEAVDIAWAQSAILAMLQNNNWIRKETGCTAVGTIGLPALEGANGKLIRGLLEKHIGDNDSDVSREAKAACAKLGIEVLEINPTTIRSALLKGDADFEEWVVHCLTFISEVTDANQMRELSRIGAVWQTIGVGRVRPKWLELAAHGNWVQREAAGLIAASFGADLLAGDSQVHDLLLNLVTDGDDDVQREARLACDILGIEYSDD